jgi:hypothetical protein
MRSATFLWFSMARAPLFLTVATEKKSRSSALKSPFSDLAAARKKNSPVTQFENRISSSVRQCTNRAIGLTRIVRSELPLGALHLHRHAPSLGPGLLCKQTAVMSPRRHRRTPFVNRRCCDFLETPQSPCRFLGALGALFGRSPLKVPGSRLGPYRGACGFCGSLRINRRAQALQYGVWGMLGFSAGAFSGSALESQWISTRNRQRATATAQAASVAE